MRGVDNVRLCEGKSRRNAVCVRSPGSGGAPHNGAVRPAKRGNSGHQVTRQLIAIVNQLLEQNTGTYGWCFRTFAWENDTALPVIKGNIHIRDDAIKCTTNGIFYTDNPVDHYFYRQKY